MGNYVDGINEVNRAEDWSWSWGFYLWNQSSNAWMESMYGVDDVSLTITRISHLLLMEKMYQISHLQYQLIQVSKSCTQMVPEQMARWHHLLQARCQSLHSHQQIFHLM